MAALSIQVPYPVFYDRDGQPLDNGNIYIGAANLDPVTNPIQVYYDDVLTIPASQPLKTNNGYIYLNGTPAQLYVNATNFSIAVKDSKNTLVYSFPDGTGISPNASGVIYNQGSAGAVDRTVENRLQDYVSVKDFGAVGDGVTDDTAAIQAALSSGQKNILIPHGTYLVTASMSVPSDVFISAYGATIDATAVTSHVFDFVSGGGIEGGAINGPGNGSFSANSIAILCEGTNNSPSAPTFVNGPLVQNVTIDGFGGYGVRLAYVNQPQVVGCAMTNLGYAGIGGVSCNDGVFQRNFIEGVTPGSPGGDAYGIFVDRENGTSETGDPRSYRCIISENTVKNVAVSAGNNGQGIDTHAGVDFTIANNIVSECEVGIFVTASLISGAQALGPKNVTVTGNVVSSTLRVGYGIQIAGAEALGTTVDFAENIVVSGNTVTGFGAVSDGSSGAIRCQNAKNCAITSNVVRRSSCNGIVINANNYGVTVASNTIIDPYDNTYAAPACVLVLGSNNKANIYGNEFIFDNAALGTNVAVQSIRINTGQTNLDLDIGRNSFLGIDATHLAYSAGTLTGVNPDDLYAQRGTATIACVSGAASNLVDITFAKRFPATPTSVVLTVTGNAAPGGKTVALRTATITTTGFRIIAYPYDLTTWSASGDLELSWRASV